MSKDADAAEGTLRATLLRSLTSAVPPTLAPGIIAAALADAGCDVLPTEGHKLTCFLLALHDKVAAEAGHVAADQVIGFAAPTGQRSAKRKRTSISGGPISGPASVSPSVLLVDDEPLELRTVGRALRAAGYELRVAEHVGAALAHLASKIPDVVVVDYHLPGMDGRQLSALIQLTAGDDCPPMIMITGGDSTAWDDDDYVAVLRKPFDTSTLIGLIDGLVGRTPPDP